MTDQKRARLLIADDHKLIAQACANMLEPEFEVVDVVTDGLALIQAAVERKPEVVITDVFMPQLNGLDAGEQIKQMKPATKLVFLTMDRSPDIAVEAFRRGASGYVLKDCAAEELIAGVRCALCDQLYLSPIIAKDVIELMLRAGVPSSPEERKITGRQKEILQLLAEGKSMKEIAFILNLKPGTVAFHKYQIMDVLGIKTSAGLIEYAIKHHMISE